MSGNQPGMVQNTASASTRRESSAVLGTGRRCIFIVAKIRGGVGVVLMIARVDHTHNDFDLR